MDLTLPSQHCPIVTFMVQVCQRLGFPVPPTEAAYGPQQAAAYEVDNKKSEAFYSEAGCCSIRHVCSLGRKKSHDFFCCN